MKIGLINNLYAPYNRGGAEEVVRQMAENFQMDGHEIFIISTKPSLKASELLTEEKLISEKLKIYYQPSSFYNLNMRPLASRWFWHLGNILSFSQTRQIKKILRLEKPDLIITHNLMGLGFLTTLAIRRLNIKHEHWLHDIQLLHPSGLLILGQEKKIDSLVARIYQTINKSLVASPEKIISPSHWLLSEHAKRGFFKESIKEVRRLNLNFSTAPLDQTISEKTLDESVGKKTFLFVGQIEEHKGVLLLINTFKKLKNPQAELLIVGDGSQLMKARQQANNDQRIKFTGRVKSSEITNLLAASHCLVIPSLCYENSPTLVALAHNLKKPIIASKLGGLLEISGPEDRLFIAGSERDLLEKLADFEY